ncbi:MAG: hypothetical protein NZM04_01315 [Methylacidiphilales bacterium]|nr:hypothetical protein [Candidatus Methylacidiphilales bacterium]
MFPCEFEKEVELAPDLLHRLIKGEDSKHYCLTTTNRLIVFPYADGELIPEQQLKQTLPLT